MTLVSSAGRGFSAVGISLALGCLPGCDGGIVSEECNRDADCEVEPWCGNGVLDPGEECEAADLGGKTCQALGFAGGEIKCTAACGFDSSACAVDRKCGDEKKDPGEDCDGADLGGATCETLGYTAGALKCLSICVLDQSTCFNPGPVFFVRTDGNDNSCDGKSNVAFASGQTECAWQTITKAVGMAAPGDTVRVQAGTYSGSVSNLTSGAEGQPITITGDGAPVLDGAWRSASGFEVSGGKSYINIAGFIIRNYLEYGVHVNNSHHINLDRLAIYNIGKAAEQGGGVRFQNNAAYSSVSNSKVHDCNWNNVMVYGAPEYIPQTSHHIAIVNNEVYNCGHSCIDIHTHLSDIDIFGNIVHRDSGAGNGGIYVHNGYTGLHNHTNIRVIGNTVYNSYWSVLAESCNNCLIEANILHHNERELVVTDGLNVTVTNNIVYAGGAGSIGLFNLFRSPQGNVVASNSLDGKGGGGAGISVDAAESVVITNNIVTNHGTGISAGSSSQLSYNDVFGNGTPYGGGAAQGVGDISVDPYFADSANGDFHLQSSAGRWNGSAWVTSDTRTSPCVGAGNPFSNNEKSPCKGVIEMGTYGNTAEASKTVGCR